MKLAAICIKVAKRMQSRAGCQLNESFVKAKADAATMGISAAESVLGRAASLQARKELGRTRRGGL